MSDSIIDVSRAFFEEVVKDILEANFPEETAQMACGVFGYGSEVLRLDDDYSADHHWGLRINALLPDDLFANKGEEILQAVDTQAPDNFRGYSLREGLITGKGLSLTSLDAYLNQTIGINHPPESYADWLGVPEEDILHIVNGELWHDPSGRFSAIRTTFNDYYPEPVRLRRIAHWCRYSSGMGTYALKRAILRDNDYFATVAFGKSLRWLVQIAFMLDKQYYPYDKWIMAFFEKLPRLYKPLGPLVEEATKLSTGWDKKLDLLHQMIDILDETMVADGIIQPHAKFAHSPTSGYRLMEHAYAEILQGLPEDIRTIVPVWDQIPLERFHSGYVSTLDINTWDGILKLIPEGKDHS